MNTKKIFAVFVLALCCHSLLAQSPEEQDALWKKWNDKNLPDTIRLDALGYFAWSFLYTNPDSAYALAQTEFDYAKKKNILRFQTDALNTQGAFYEVKGEHIKALEKYQQKLKLLMGSGREEGIAGTYNNIGNIYIAQEEFKKALSYYQQALKYYEKVQNKLVMATIYGNIGNAWHGQEDRKTALEWYLKSIRLYEEIKNEEGVARVSLNAATLYYFLKEYQKSMIYFLRSYDYYKKTQDKWNLSAVCINLGALEVDMGKIDEGMKNCQEGLAIAKTLGARLWEQNAYNCLYKAYKQKGDLKKALQAHEMYTSLRDSLANADLKAKILQKDVAFKYEKKISNDSIQNAEQKKVQQAELDSKNAYIRQKQTQQYALYAGLALILVFAGFLYSRFRVISQQKKIIEEQKLMVEEKNHEIMDSIQYAQRIQDAYLPPERIFHHIFEDAFLLFKPKDIVSGDFYWFFLQQGDNQPGDVAFFAVADCTGHGVPGAIMSVICCNALNEVAVTRGLTDPGKILDETRKIVIRTLKSGSGSGQKDGMDIALGRFNRVTGELWYAGANNPMIVVRQGTHELIELKPDKQPVGPYEKPVDFNTSYIRLAKGDSIYAFSDGYADQFGGPKGKKYKYSQLSKLLQEISILPKQQQKEKLEQSFEAWRGQLEQVDDVCIIGIRI